MKKILLSLVAAGAATFSAGAEKVVFIASDAFKFYDGDAHTIFPTDITSPRLMTALPRKLLKSLCQAVSLRLMHQVPEILDSKLFQKKTNVTLHPAAGDGIRIRA